MKKIVFYKQKYIVSLDKLGRHVYKNLEKKEKTFLLSLTLKGIPNYLKLNKEKRNDITLLNPEERKLRLEYSDDLEPQIELLKSTKKTNHTWLFVIGAEKYQETDNINFATRSANFFTELMQKKYGIGKNRTIKLINEKATAGQIIDKLQELVETVEKGESIIFYYNGHGVPVPEKNNAAYILPTDADPNYVGKKEDLKLTTIYQKLDNSKADKVIVVMDSCFTGVTDGK